MGDKSVFHGSDIEYIAGHFNLDRDKIINYSDNVNPLGLSSDVINKLKEKIDLISSYPDREYKVLKKSLADYVHADERAILVGNGATDLISLFIKTTNAKKALIVSPSYSEYEREIALIGGKISYFELLEDDSFIIDVDALKKSLSKDINLLILCNPNNPTSSLIKRDKLTQILDFTLEKNIKVMIDETYIEFSGNARDYSATTIAKNYPNLLVIRGMSKFFAVPGLRLGYCVCYNENLLNEFNNRKNPWVVNSIAAYAGELLVHDSDYILRSIHFIESEKERIYDILKSMEFIKVFPVNSNFFLLKILNEKTSTQIFEYLIKKNIMIRDASSFPFLSDKFIRFCIRTVAENDLLLDELDSALLS